MVEQNKDDSGKSRKSIRKAARKAQLSEILRRRNEYANRPPDDIERRSRAAKREKDKRDREATREIVRKQAENMDLKHVYTNSLDPGPAVKRGPRGGNYTEAVTKEGRPYRRYF